MKNYSKNLASSFVAVMATAILLLAVRPSHAQAVPHLTSVKPTPNAVITPTGATTTVYCGGTGTFTSDYKNYDVKVNFIYQKDGSPTTTSTFVLPCYVHTTIDVGYSVPLDLEDGHYTAGYTIRAHPDDDSGDYVDGLPTSFTIGYVVGTPVGPAPGP